MKLLQKNKRCTWSQDTYMSILMYHGYIPPQKKNRRPIDEIAQKKQNKKQRKYRAQGDGRLAAPSHVTNYQINCKKEDYRLSSTCGAPRNHTNVQPVDAHV